MAFWKSDADLPPELKGKTPEEIVAAMKLADELKTTAATEKAAREAAEAATVAQKTEMDALKAKVTELEAKQTPTPIVEEEEPVSPWTDPEKFVADQTKGIAGVALQSGMMTAKMYTVQQLSARDARIFKHYEKEVDQVIGTFAPAARVMPQSWMNAFLYVKGLHDVDIHKAETSKTEFFSETPSRGEHHEEPPEDRLTEEEEQICKTFHFDPKTYLERKKTATLSQSAKGAYARYPVQTTK